MHNSKLWHQNLLKLTSSPLYCFRQCINLHVLASQRDTTSKSFPLLYRNSVKKNLFKITQITFFAQIKVIYYTLMTPLMLLMVELSRALTL